MGNKEFYVIFDIKRKGFVQDSQWGYTENVLVADQYDSLEQARKELSYYADSANFKIKRVHLVITDVE